MGRCRQTAGPGGKDAKVRMMPFDFSTRTDDGLSLGRAPRNFRGVVQAVAVTDSRLGLPPEEMERRLLELGFVEGAQVQLLHEGLIGRDPIAIRVNGTTVALRRREAMAIRVAQAG